MERSSLGIFVKRVLRRTSELKEGGCDEMTLMKAFIMRTDHVMDPCYSDEVKRMEWTE
jgi:hypothetical protein